MEEEIQQAVSLGGEDKRGLALIITNQYLDTSKPLRFTIRDAEAMKKTMNSLKFATITLLNVTQQDTKGIIKAIAKYKKYPPSYKCFIVVFSGHGGQNNVLFSNDLEEVDINEDILQALGSMQSPKQFSNSPKIVIIDACRGSKTKVVQGAAKDLITDDAQMKDVPEPPSNVLAAFSTTQDYQAFGGSDGSIWLQTLATVLESSRKSIGDTIAGANKIIRRKYGKWQDPQIRLTTVNIVLSDAGKTTLLEG